jgi:hypothetical protein
MVRDDDQGLALRMHTYFRPNVFCSLFSVVLKIIGQYETGPAPMGQLGTTDD